MNRLIKPTWLLFILGGLGACNLEKEIEIELPAYEERLVLECYLEPGKPFFALLTKSAGYFDPFPSSNDQFLENILESGAEVTITHRGKVYRLENQILFDPFTRKVFNYYHPDLVPADFETDFQLAIRTKTGKTISAVTRVLPVVPIDSIVVQYDQSDTLARVLTYFSDIPDEKNYFRRVLHKGSLDTIPLQDFTVEDSFAEDSFVFGTGYEFEPGDTVINTLYHIDENYYEFLESYQRAILANGNPFAQPSPIISSLEGTAEAVGVFTGISYARITTIIKK